MDIRKYKEKDQSVKQVPEELKDNIVAADESILKIDTIANDYRYYDSLILNLYQKKLTQEQLLFDYYER